jgi:hypothetical protein
MGSAVLQKPEEEHKERSFAVLLLCLDGHAEQFCDKRRLSQAVSLYVKILTSPLK